MLSARSSKTYLYLGFFLLIIIFAHYRGWLAPLERGARSLVIPVISRVHGLSVSDSGNVTLSDSTSSTNPASATGSAIEVLIARVKILETENGELKKQVDFKNNNHLTWVTTAVLGRALDSSANTVIIGAGTAQGVLAGQPVVAGDGVLVGKVIKAQEDIAIVRLLNDSQFKISAMITNKDNSLGIVAGGYGLSLRMELIPRNEIVVVGDVVVTGGLEIECPRGLPIGTIAVVENEAYKPFQQAVLTPMLDLSRLTAVSVLVSDIKGTGNF